MPGSPTAWTPIGAARHSRSESRTRTASSRPGRASLLRCFLRIRAEDENDAEALRDHRERLLQELKGVEHLAPDSHERVQALPALPAPSSTARCAPPVSAGRSTRAGGRRWPPTRTATTKVRTACLRQGGGRRGNVNSTGMNARAPQRRRRGPLAPTKTRMSASWEIISPSVPAPRCA
jgi:hypothetical protein